MAGDPNFAPFDPVEGDPALTPAERVKRGFEATRVINRDAPGYPGSFLYAGDVFDPAQRHLLGVPVAPSVYTPVPFKSPSYSREMAKQLGAGDIDKEYDDKVVAWIKKTLGH